MGARNILLLRPHDGEKFLEAISLIKKQSPDAAVTVLELPYHERIVAEELIARVIVFPNNITVYSPLRCGWAFLRDIRRERFDTAFMVFETEETERFSTSVLFALLTGARKVIALGPGSAARRITFANFFLRLSARLCGRLARLLLTVIFFVPFAACFIPAFIYRFIKLRGRTAAAIDSAAHGPGPRKLQVAICRPTEAQNNAFFETKARLYEYLQERYGDIEFTVFADKRNNYKNDKLHVREVVAWEVPLKLFRLCRHVLNFPVFNYVSLRWKLKGFDVIETDDPLVYISPYYAYLGARKRQQRLAIWVSACREGLFGGRESWMKAFAKKVTSYASAILTVSPRAVARLAGAGLIDEHDPKITVTGHPINTDLFAPSPPPDDGKIKILSVGRLQEAKGHDIAIRAVKRLAEEYDTIEFKIVSEGPERENLKKLIAELKLGDTVTLVGAVPYHNLPEWYNWCDIFVLHSLKLPYSEEAFGMALAEAASSARPIVTTNVGGIPFVVPEGTCALYAKERDVEDLAAKIKTLIDDTKLRARLGTAARRHIVEHFSLANVAEVFYTLYKKGAN